MSLRFKISLCSLKMDYLIVSPSKKTQHQHVLHATMQDDLHFGANALEYDRKLFLTSQHVKERREQLTVSLLIKSVQMTYLSNPGCGLRWRVE